MDLSVAGKLLWIYCLTNCDHAGIIEWNKKLIRFQTDIEDLETVTEELGKSLVTVKEHLKFIPKFFEYQYPNYPHKRFAAADGAVRVLLKYDLLSLINLTLTQDFIKSLSIGKSISKSKKGGAGGRSEQMDLPKDYGIPSKDAVPMPEEIKKRLSKIGKQ
jgi:hypothetical protein